MTWSPDQYLFERKNWGRWGPADEKGAANLVTPEKTLRAATLIRTGSVVSLSRDVSTAAGPDNPFPSEHFMISADLDERGPALGGKKGVITDYLGCRYHGLATTHVDALCHVWSEHGMWGGRAPEDVVTLSGSRWADISNLRDGIATRGVLLDIPALRNQPYVSIDQPVECEELRAATDRQGVCVESGDALVVYCGRDEWESQPCQPAYRTRTGGRAGLGASCVRFIRESDVALVLWDMLDATTGVDSKYGSVHGVLWAFGVSLVDNCDLGPLLRKCREEGRYEFMLTMAPLAVPGGTGSPVNPIAIF